MEPTLLGNEWNDGAWRQLQATLDALDATIESDRIAGRYPTKWPDSSARESTRAAREMDGADVLLDL
jgi:hypothetical protein